MKKIIQKQRHWGTLCGAAVFVLAALMWPAAAQSGSQSYSEYFATGEPPDFEPLQAPNIGMPGGLTFYTDRSAFEDDFPGLPLEDFSNTLVPINNVEACSGPFNRATNNACFAPGGLISGFSLDNLQGNENAVLTPPIFGVTDVSVGPDWFADDTDLTFSTTVNAVGLGLLSPLGEAAVEVEVFGTSCSLGTTTVLAGLPPGNFFGVFSRERITKISFHTPGNEGELISNLQFGPVRATPVPALSALGLMLLIALLLSASIIALRRRKVTVCDR